MKAAADRELAAELRDGTSPQAAAQAAASICLAIWQGAVAAYQGVPAPEPAASAPFMHLAVGVTPEAMDGGDELGKPVVRLAWAGDSAAHTGSAVIYAQPAGFLLDTDEETYGPFGTLAGALTADTFHFGDTPGPALTCLPETAALPALHAAAFNLAGGPGGTVRINGVEHVRIANGLARLL